MMVETYKKLEEDLITAKLDTMKYVDYIYPNGAFYVFIDLSQVAKKYINIMKVFLLNFVMNSVSKYNVAIVPGKAFGIDEYVRISYACSEKEFYRRIKQIRELYFRYNELTIFYISYVKEPC